MEDLYSVSNGLKPKFCVKDKESLVWMSCWIIYSHPNTLVYRIRNTLDFLHLVSLVLLSLSVLWCFYYDVNVIDISSVHSDCYRVSLESLSQLFVPPKHKEVCHVSNYNNVDCCSLGMNIQFFITFNYMVIPGCLQTRTHCLSNQSLCLDVNFCVIGRCIPSTPVVWLSTSFRSGWADPTYVVLI